MPQEQIRLALLTRDNSDAIQHVADRLAAFIRDQPAAMLTQSAVVEDLERGVLDETDVVVVLGGDGAIIRASRQLGETQLPILGVRRGRLGFLAELTPAEFETRFAEISSRSFQITEHVMMHCSLFSEGIEPQAFLALNEVAVSSREALEMIEVDLEIDDAPVMRYSCDGLLVATPVGSTAHSLSAGGPAIRQDLPVFVVTPICPHTLSNRSLVDSSSRTYRLRLADARTDVVMIIDGQTRVPFRVGDEVEIRRADPTFKLARLAGHNYYSMLQTKLGWTGQPRYSTDE